MRRLLLPALALAALACDLEFVALEPAIPRGLVRIVSAHDEGLRAEIEVSHSVIAGAIHVTLDGEVLAGVELEPGAGHWTHATSISVDSLDPVLELGVQAGDHAIDLVLPVLARAGPADWLPSGDLRLPITLDRSFGDPQIGLWEIALLDGNGRELVNVRAFGSQLPDPLVISGSMVPDSAVVARVENLARVSLDEPYPLHVHVEGSAVFPLRDA